VKVLRLSAGTRTVARMERARLAGLSFFAGLPDAELDAISQVTQERTFASGDALMQQGAFGHALLVIESGTADVTSDGVVVYSAGPGEVIGEMAVLSSGRRTATVTATSPVQALEIFKRDLWDLEDVAPEVSARFRSVIAQRRGAAPAR
jgi:CRP-like cAMP-binding protein